MQEIQITRSFRYNSITLPDPNPALGPEQVREFYAGQYPELNNAVVEGPTTRNATATYTFTRAAGAKGASAELRSAGEIVQDALRGKEEANRRSLLVEARHRHADRLSDRFCDMALRLRGDGTHLPIPSDAFGMWG